MKVRVTQVAFWDGSRRRVGQVLEVPDGIKGSWFEVVEGQPSAASSERQKRAKPAPIALSEIGKEPPVGPLDPPAIEI
jgi:hypothetical protein